MATLYKYRTYSARALEMLIRRELYFAPPPSLNDPYDCQINIRESLQEAIAQTNSPDKSDIRRKLERLRTIDHVYEKMDNDLAGMGVLSLSKNADNVLMWSHYAENHAGFCAGFELPERLTSHLGTEKIIGAIEVSYSTNNPFLSYFEGAATGERPPEWPEFWQSLLSIGMVTKASTWSYEDEVRVLRGTPGPVSFSAADLTEIIFGMNMPASSRDTISKILSGPDWRHVKFRETVRSRRFGVEVRDATVT